MKKIFFLLIFNACLNVTYGQPGPANLYLQVFNKEGKQLYFNDTTNKKCQIKAYYNYGTETKSVIGKTVPYMKDGVEFARYVIFECTPTLDKIEIKYKKKKNSYRIKKDEKWGVLTEAEETISPEWNRIITNDSLRLFICTKKEEISVFNFQGELIINSTMSSYEYDNPWFLVIEKKRRYLYYDLRHKNPTKVVRKVKAHESWSHVLIPNLVSKEPYIVRTYTRKKGFMFIDSLGESIMSQHVNCMFAEPVLFNGELIGVICNNPDFDFNQSNTDSIRNRQRNVRLQLFNGVEIEDDFGRIFFDSEYGYFQAQQDETRKDNYFAIYSEKGEMMMSFFLQNSLKYYDYRFGFDLSAKDIKYRQKVKEYFEKTGVGVSKHDDFYILENNEGKKMIINIGNESISPVYNSIKGLPNFIFATNSHSIDIFNKKGELLFSNTSNHNSFPSCFSFDKDGVRYWMTRTGVVYMQKEI